MSEELNKEIRDFFIKIGEDIKNAFDECCPCITSKRARIYAQEISDIENQITQDMKENDVNSGVVIKIDDDEQDIDDDTDLEVEHLVLEDNVVVRKKIKLHIIMTVKIMIMMIMMIMMMMMMNLRQTVLTVIVVKMVL